MSLVTTSWGPNRLDIFTPGNDGNIWHTSWDPVMWQGWEGEWDSLGGPPGGYTGELSAVSWGPNRLDLFTIGKDQHVWHNSWDGGNWEAAWDDRGAPAAGIVSGLSAVSYGVNRLDVFAGGSDGHIWHTSWYGDGWQDEWDDRGAPPGPYFGDVSAVSWGFDRLDVFSLGEGGIYHNAWDGNRWQDVWDDRIPGLFIADWSVVSRGPNLLDIFGRDIDGNVWHTSGDGNAWQDWDNRGGPPLNPPALIGDIPCLSWGPNRLDVFGLGNDGHIWHTSWDPEVWQGWQGAWDDRGMPAGGAFDDLSAVSWGANRLDVFCLGDDGNVWHTAWDGNEWLGWDNQGAPPGGVGA